MKIWFSFAARLSRFMSHFPQNISALTGLEMFKRKGRPIIEKTVRTLRKPEIIRRFSPRNHSGRNFRKDKNRE